MSNNPNNPFDDNQQNQGYSQGAPPQKSSKVWLWVLGTIGVLGVVGALVCCGGGYFAMKAGTGMLAEVFKQQLIGNPTIDEHIGDIESMEMNFGATQQHADESQGAIAFDISGSKGSGTILIKQDPSGDGTGIATAELIMSDGSRHPVDVEGGGGVLNEDFKIDLGQPDTEPAESF